MKRISAIAVSLLLVIGLASESQAFTAGSYRCVALQGSFDTGITDVFPVVMHYNPNASVQHITRLRVYDSSGTLIYDSGTIPVGGFPVNGFGSAVVISGTSGFSEGLLFIVNWKQSADVRAPIPKINMLTIDTATGATRSMAQSNCP